MKKTFFDETSLLHSARCGDLDAFNQLVLLYQDLLFRTALNILWDEEAAADASQDAFISAFRNLQSFRGGSFRAWLTRVTVNICYDQLRRKWRHPTLALEPGNPYDQDMDASPIMVDPFPQPLEQVETRELGDALQRALQGLDPKYRVVAALVDLEGFSYEEAAGILKVPVGTIKSRLARARLALRNYLSRFLQLLPWRIEQIPELENATAYGLDG